MQPLCQAHSVDYYSLRSKSTEAAAVSTPPYICTTHNSATYGAYLVKTTKTKQNVTRPYKFKIMGASRRATSNLVRRSESREQCGWNEKIWCRYIR
jgi:hypothetical protein